MDHEPLAKIGRKVKGNAQIIGRGADILLANASGRYIGRTCSSLAPWLAQQNPKNSKGQLQTALVSSLESSLNAKLEVESPFTPETARCEFSFGETNSA